MAWSAPSSVTTGDLITAATWNQDVVDNVQYLHDNRSWVFVITTVKHDTTSTSYTHPSARSSYYKGTLVDEADLNAAYFVVNLVAAGGASAFVQLYNYDLAASITGTILSTTETSACHVEESADVKANLPTGDTILAHRQKSSDGGQNASVRWAGIWFDF
jgi:hypothetical protein